LALGRRPPARAALEPVRFRPRRPAEPARPCPGRGYGGDHPGAPRGGRASRAARFAAAAGRAGRLAAPGPRRGGRGLASTLGPLPGAARPRLAVRAAKRLPRCRPHGRALPRRPPVACRRQLEVVARRGPGASHDGGTMIRRRRPLQRHEDPAIARALLDRGLHPVLCRLLASRGARDAAELDMALAGLAAPDALADGWRAAELLAGAIDAGERICVVADYDCDGATACAVAVRGLRRFGARIDYLVPNRFTHGYGLSPAVVALARSHPRLGEPQWLVTVDNGIASVEGVEAAHRAGMKVIVTDHHLPGPVLPAAEAIVNPNRVDCGFPSKHLAGVGVVFYLLGLLRAQRRARGDASVDLVDLLDLVAVGT